MRRALAFLFALFMVPYGIVFQANALSAYPRDNTVYQKLNNEILEAATRYVDKSRFIPDKEAVAMYLVAATSVENQGAGDPKVFSAVRMTGDVYTSNPNALKEYSTYNSFGMRAYDDYSSLGPLSLANHFVGKSVVPAENGVLGGQRYDPIGVLGDRSNWYDSCNMAVKHIDDLWRKYLRTPSFRRGIDLSNPYSVVAITAMSMHQGSSVLLEYDGFLPAGFTENATPRFWFDWSNILTQEKYTNQIREYVLENRPLIYANDETINRELVIPILKSMREDALAMREDFFDNNRYTSNYNWVTGDTSYKGYVGLNAVKTSAAVKVLVSYIITEERYSGSY